MSYDFLNNYLPAAEDITVEELQAARAHLTALLAVTNPEQDTRPGSVFGTWVVDPYAQLAAALNIAVSRLQDDLNVAGVADGVVWNCDFVERRLLALGGVRQESVKSFGYIRLEFTQDLDVDLPGGMRVLFNTQDVFVLATPPGTAKIRRIGSVVEDGNTFLLTMLAPGRYGVVLPVSGYSTSAIPAGAAAQLDTSIPELRSLTAFSKFVVGRVNNSVPAMARRTATTFWASGFASRGGVRKQLGDVFPDLLGASVLLAGDPEMLRSSSTALGVGSGAVDVFVRSQCRTTVTQTIRLNLVSDQSSVAVNKFLGVWKPNEQVTRLDSIQWAGNTAIGLTYRLVARSAAADRAPLLTCAYSALEQFEVSVDVPVSDGGAPLVTTSQDDEGVFAYFTFTYECDPGVTAVQKFIDNEEPAGLDVLARAPMQLILRKLVFHYDKEPGVLFNVEQAQADVENYLAALFAPAQFNEADLNDMVYAAGASSVLRVELLADLRLSCAQLVVDKTAPSLLVDYAAAMAAARAVPQIVLADIRTMNPAYIDPLAGTDAQTLGSVGKQNVACTLMPGALKFLHAA